MCSTLKRHGKAIYKNIYLSLNTLIDIMFSLFHLFTDEKELSIKWATIFKFVSTATINVFDIFKEIWFPCSCSCCSCCCKKKVEEELEYDEIIEINKKKIKALQLEMKIKNKIKSEKNESNEQYLLVKKQLSTIEKLKEENKKIIIIVD